ncbi:MAG TPA: ABC transporter ATP-binding protein [Conexibacter sp.]|nr:ABC transporter ATP-binding protein [Conexibacter sp.]
MSALAARSLTAGYGAMAVVRALELEVAPGEVVALLGPNGAGKSTTLLTLAGALPALGGETLLDGRPTTAPLHRRARAGLAFVAEERTICAALSVADNLRLGAGGVAPALALFPELKPLLRRRAGLLSGGEQQMLALGRALAARPQALLVDELSLGLAPLIVGRLLRAVREAADGGLAVLLVEQHATQALEVADRVYVLRRGELVLHAPAAELRADPQRLQASYLEGEDRS